MLKMIYTKCFGKQGISAETGIFYEVADYKSADGMNCKAKLAEIKPEPT